MGLLDNNAYDTFMQKASNISVMLWLHMYHLRYGKYNLEYLRLT